jgi:hypothetical protein
MSLVQVSINLCSCCCTVGNTPILHLVFSRYMLITSFLLLEVGLESLLIQISMNLCISSFLQGRKFSLSHMHDYEHSYKTVQNVFYTGDFKFPSSAKAVVTI